jgi:hypothetical protein
VALSQRWRRRAGVGGEGPDNQLEGRKEGGGGRGEGNVQHDVLVGTAAAARHRGFCRVLDIVEHSRLGTERQTDA